MKELLAEKNPLYGRATGIYKMTEMGFYDAIKFLIGECKFKGKPFSYSEYLDTICKLAPQKEKAVFYYALFSESGFDKKIQAEAANNDHLLLYSLADIVGKQRQS